MVSATLDHLVVAAATLEAGVAHVEQMLGVTVPFGGKHPLMGTHNCLMKLGETCFLEIVAIDPEAVEPHRPRWFTLDNPDIRAALTVQPRLHTWLCRVGDIAGAVAASPISPGVIQEGRRGDLVWRITIPEDGAMPEGGLFPMLIQWPESLGPNGPAARMVDLGCSLEKLTITAPAPEKLKSALEAIGFDGPVEIGSGRPGGLVAHIMTPGGPRELR